jgi:alpha-1,4-digalacturonate transport system permease protein
VTTQATKPPSDTANYRWPGAALGADVLRFLFRRKGRGRFNGSDFMTYAFLIIGTLIMFVPVLWVVMSSFKSSARLADTPPSFFPLRDETIMVVGYEAPLTLIDVTAPDGTVRRLARVGGPKGINQPAVDPANPAELIQVNMRENKIANVRSIRFDFSNYEEAVTKFPFWTYLRNSVVITVSSTIITLLINSMAAFALSKYKFRGRSTILFIIISTLMVPLAVVLIPIYFVIVEIGWFHNLLGVIIPPAATPTGVFLLRQYMLTIPDELIEAARIDGSSEWRIYWQIILPLTGPALAVLAIFSIVWRWNDFLWPLIVLGGREELATLQLGLNNFQGALNTRWHLILAMTVLTLLPITVVFAFLQRYITSGIATTGIKG